MGYDTIENNLAESSVRDLNLGSLNVNFDQLILQYGEHKGDAKLRNLIIKSSEILHENDVLVTAGAATALFIVATSLLAQSDHLVVIRPNYATNIETPRAIGCEIAYVDLSFEDGYALSFEKIIACIKPNTKLISLTNPHNPSGKLFDKSVVEKVIQFAESKEIYVLCDETYRTLNFNTNLEPYASEISPFVISVASLSKAYGVPGIRIGWLICRDKLLMSRFLAAKEQIMICNSVLDEAVAVQILLQEDKLLTAHHKHIRSNFEIVEKWMTNHTYLEWNVPDAGVVGLIKIKDEFAIETSKFYDELYYQYQTILGPGHWFEQDDCFFRLGFGYPTQQELINGLGNIDKVLKNLSNHKA
jgi:aspartate/methionine/tyrosine aminotransferase